MYNLTFKIKLVNFISLFSFLKNIIEKLSNLASTRLSTENGTSLQDGLADIGTTNVF